MHLQQVVLLGLVLSIVLTVLGFGLQATWDDVSYVVRRPAYVARALLAMLVIMPLVALTFQRVFSLPLPVEVALVALAISPVPPLLPRREDKAGVHAPYGIALMATAALLSVVAIPLAVALLGWMFDQPFHMGVGTVALKVVETALLPLLVGMALRALTPGLAARLTSPVAHVAAVLLVLCALVLVGTQLPAVWALIGNGALLALLGFVVLGLLAGHLLAGSEPDDQIVLALSTACRHPALALAIGATNFPDENLVPCIVLYLMVNLAVGAAYLAWQRRRLARAVALTSPARVERGT